MRKVCISFHTCHRTMLDGARLIDYFRANGWDITTSFKEADLVVFQDSAALLPKPKDIV